MSKQSALKECLFFLVQYAPNPVHGESINIGLLLYCRKESYLGCMFTRDFQRAKAFHPQADLEFLRELGPYFQQQIEEHRHDLDGFLRELQSYSNMIQIGPPQSCLLREPKREVGELFVCYVR